VKRKLAIKRPNTGIKIPCHQHTNDLHHLQPSKSDMGLDPLVRMLQEEEHTVEGKEFKFLFIT
jgi:hypothetical protein